MCVEIGVLIHQELLLHPQVKVWTCLRIMHSYGALIMAHLIYASKIVIRIKSCFENDVSLRAFTEKNINVIGSSKYNLLKKKKGTLQLEHRWDLTILRIEIELQTAICSRIIWWLHIANSKEYRSSKIFALTVFETVTNIRWIGDTVR